jgi:hypothetical protein
MSEQTDTPRTDEWETYCDECYYHLWRVRRRNERGFNDGFHVHNGDEAKALVDLLNKQDSELTAARAEIERLDVSGIHSCHDKCQRWTCVMRRERDEARAEIEKPTECYKVSDEEFYRYHSLLYRATKKLETVTEQRDRLQKIVDEQCRVSSVCREYREQRDRLAEALRMITTFNYSDLQCDNGHGAKYVATEALQSLTTNEQ